MKEMQAGAERVFAYPDLDRGFIPQGIDLDESLDAYFLSGYSSVFGPSPVYVLNRRDGKLIAHAVLNKENGKDFSGHSGGIAVWHDYVYVAATNDGVYIFSRQDVLHAKNGEWIRALGHIPVRVSDRRVKASFLSVHDDVLTIGEFRIPVILDTPESHHFLTASGEKRNALAVSFSLTENQPFGVNPDPVSVYAIPDYSQGILFVNHRIVISAAVLEENSHIYVFDETKLKECARIETDGRTIPVYGLDSSVLTGVREFPPMNEEAEYVDGRLVIVNESASGRYRIGRLFGMEYCYSFPAEELIPETETE